MVFRMRPVVSMLIIPFQKIDPALLQKKKIMVKKCPMY